MKGIDLSAQPDARWVKVKMGAMLPRECTQGIGLICSAVA